MIRILSLNLLFTLAICVNAQNDSLSEYPLGEADLNKNLEAQCNKDSIKFGVDEPDVYDVVGEMPSFPGGDTALVKFMNKNLFFPVVAVEQGIERRLIEDGVEGHLVVSFIVEKDGSLSNIEVIKNLDPSCDYEATRVVKMSPKWNPGKQNGQPVRVRYTFPIKFKLLK